MSNKHYNVKPKYVIVKHCRGAYSVRQVYPLNAKLRGFAKYKDAKEYLAMLEDKISKTEYQL